MLSFSFLSSSSGTAADTLRLQIKLEHSRMGTIKTLKAAVGDMVKCDPKLVSSLSSRSYFSLPALQTTDAHNAVS